MLDNNFAVVTEEKQEPFNVFDDVKQAIAYAALNIKEKGGLVCVINGPDENLLHYITPENLKNLFDTMFRLCWCCHQQVFPSFKFNKPSYVLVTTPTWAKDKL